MRNSTGKLSSLVKRGKQFKKGKIKLPIAMLLFAALVAGGGLAYQAVADADATITPVSDGSNISIDTTSSTGGSGIYQVLDGPGITEGAAGDILEGTHTITLPIGWEFDVNSTITIAKIGNIVLESTNITPTSDSFSFVVNNKSTSNSVLLFGNLRVVPTVTNITEANGNMTYSGDGIAGVDGTINFGTLSTIAGAVTRVAFTTEPGGATYGSDLSPQPVVKTQDQFGNDSTNGLAESETVSLALTGTGALQGTVTLDIGTEAGDGTATFSGLTVDTAGTGNILTASATSLDGDTSDSFDILQKGITLSITASNKPYDGNADAIITDYILEGVIDGDNVVASGGTATFASADVGTYTVTATGVSITGDDAGNYIYNTTAYGIASITAVPLTIKANTGQTKVYGATEPTLTATFSGFVNSEDESVLGGSLTRVDDENVGTYVITNGYTSGNYEFDYAEANFEITKAPLTVDADNQTKEFGASDPALTYTHGALVNNDTESVFSGSLVRTGDENVGTYAINQGDLSAGGNYDITYTAGTFTITKATPVITWETPTDIGYGTALSSTQLDASASVDGTFVYTPASGTVLNAGAHVLSTEFTPDDSTNYNTVTKTVDINVTKAPLTVDANTGQTKVYGATEPTLTATFSGFVNSEDESVLTGSLTRVDNENVGTYAITNGYTSGNYDINYTEADFVITKAPLTVDANTGQTKVYGATEPTLTATFSGFVNSEDESVLTGSLTRVDNENVGTYAITNGYTSGNYDINYTEADFVITKAPLTVVADDQTKEFGASDPALTYTHGALVNNDTESVFSGSLVRTGDENVGTYAINQGDLSAGGNYNIAYTAGIFTIEDTTAPNAPGNVSATAVAGGNIEIFFDDVDEAGSSVVSYSVKRSTVTEGSYTQVGTVTDNESSTYTYTDTSLTDGTTYYYVVTAIDGSSNPSVNSDEVSATSDATDPTVNITSTVFPLTNTSPIPVTIIFSEEVTDLTLGEISITNGTGVLTYSEANYETNYDLAITPAGQGVVTVNIAANVAWDLAGNYNKAAQEFTINYDSQAPSITALSVSPNSGTSIVDDIITLTIIADQTGYTASNITINNVDIATVSLIDNGDGIYTATYLITEGNSDVVSGAITASVVLEDEAGNKNTAYTNVISNTLAIDANTPVINSVTSDATGAGWLKVGDTITFTADIDITETDLIITPVTYNGGDLVWATINDGDTYTATYTVEEGQSDQTFALQLTGVQAADLASNSSIIVDGSDVVKTIDANTPEVTLLSTFAGQTLVGGTNPSVNWTAADDNFGATPIKLEYSVNGGIVWLVIAENTENNTGSFGYAHYAWTVPNNINSSACYIRVTAVDLAGNITIKQNATPFTISNTTTTPKPICTDLGNGNWSCDISLNQGWNLISSPVVVNSTPASVFSEILENINVVQHYNLGNWSSYVPNASAGNTLDEVKDGKGYWIYMNESDILTLIGLADPAVEGGSLVPDSYIINNGDWNLIGFRSVKNMNAKEYVEHYIDGAFGKNYIMWKYGNGTSLEPLYSSDYMEPGYGYWLNVK